MVILYQPLVCCRPIKHHMPCLSILVTYLNYGTRSSGSTSGGGISTLNPCLDGDVTRSSFAIATPSATGTGTDNGGNDIDTEISEF